MTGRPLEDAKLPGAVRTLNGRGFMLTAIDDFAREFIEQAAAHPGSEALDLGCAYGVATLAALAAGARVCACDMEARHLAAVEEQTPARDRPRLRTVRGILPEVQFAPASFGNILASRVIHFLTGADVTRAIASMAQWLQPGGRLYLVVDTPYMPSWNAIVPAYESAKAAGNRWPAFIADFSPYVSPPGARDAGPAFLNPLDPDILERECRACGLEVERSGWFGLRRLGSESNGREHAGCVARRPP